MPGVEREPEGAGSARRSLAALLLSMGVSAAFAVAFIVVVGLDPGITFALLAALLVSAASAYRVLFGSPRRAGGITVGRTVMAGALATLVVFGAIQAIPHGRDHTNPPVVSEPAWDSPRTRELAAAACFLCHSNETRWPGYTNVAPVSWALTDHILTARDTFNFSAWEEFPTSARLIEAAIRDGRMPPWNFRLLHPEARLSAAEKEELIAGIRATLGG